MLVWVVLYLVCKVEIGIEGSSWGRQVDLSVSLVTTRCLCTLATVLRYFGYPVLAGTITYRNSPISCDGCNKNTWKHSLMALENIRQCDSNFGNWWPLVMNQTFLILAQFNSLCGMKEEKKSRFRLRITTPGRNIAGSAVHLHLKREQLCSNGGKCGPLQRPKMSQQFEHSTVTVLAALFGNNINDTQWSRWQL